MSVAYQQIIKEVTQGRFAPVYFLSGEEAYFIDEVEKAILAHAFQPGEEDFNLDILYAKDISNLNELISTCRQYPVFAARRVVLLREAQSLNKQEQWAALESYLVQPMESTVLVISFKHKTIDKRWSVTKKITARAVYLEAAKLKDHELPGWITGLIESKGFSIDPSSALLLAENLGNDLSRIVNEAEKLALSLRKGEVVNAEVIELYIGISRDYNNLELLNAIQSYNTSKAVRIIDYFSRNPKAGPMPLVIGTLYSFFSKLWLYYQLSPEERRNDAALNKFLGGYYGAQNVKNATRFYPPQKSEQAIALLAEYDARSKGIGNKNTGEHALMLELIYKLMH